MKLSCGQRMRLEPVTLSQSAYGRQKSFDSSFRPIPSNLMEQRQLLTIESKAETSRVSKLTIVMN